MWKGDKTVKYLFKCKFKKISRFFQHSNLDLFLYKANIKGRGQYTSVIILCVSVYLSALIFRIYEDYEPKSDLVIYGIVFGI